MKNPEEFDIKEIVESGSILTHFQPLVSFKRGRTFGFEALSRATDPRTGKFIPPNILFNLPKNFDEMVYLDQACRETAIKNFAPFYHQHPEMMLAININANIIGEQVHNGCHFARCAQQYDILPQSIIIEIIESKAESTETLVNFTEHCKRAGFLLALDDFGNGHSNLSRIARVRPHIIKLDRSLVTNINNQFYKSEIVHSIVKMAERVGAIPLAEGIETTQEAETLIGLGIELLQGFHFARPAPIDSVDFQHKEKIKNIGDAVKQTMVQNYRRKKRVNQKFRLFIGKMNKVIAELDSVDELNEYLWSLSDNSISAECIYALDNNGIQVTDSILAQNIQQSNSVFFSPSKRGSDHSLKHFVLPFHSGATSHISEPYISLATGNRCTTVSRKITTKSGTHYLLCADINHETLKDITFF